MPKINKPQPSQQITAVETTGQTVVDEIDDGMSSDAAQDIIMTNTQDSILSYRKQAEHLQQQADALKALADKLTEAYNVIEPSRVAFSNIKNCNC
jgi:ATP-dependent Zn protease